MFMCICIICMYMYSEFCGTYSIQFYDDTFFCIVTVNEYMYVCMCADF